LPDLRLTPSFSKRLKRKEAQLQDAILRTVHKLGTDPTIPGLHTHPIQGTRNPKVFEAYVDHKNRVTWCWADDGAIKLLAHCNHDVLNTPFKSTS
jgi:hypothetical protein